MGRLAPAAAALTLGLMDPDAKAPLAPGTFRDPDCSDHAHVNTQTETQAIQQLLEGMYADWNQHNIEAFMMPFWRSSELLAVIDEEVFQGWNALYKYYKNGYPDRNAMGFISVNRIHIKLLRPDLAAAVALWTFEYTPRHAEIVGSSTMNLEKFPEGWRIIFAHWVF